MPQYRVTFMMNQSVFGWSEVYLTRGNVSASNFVANLNDLLTKRNAIMWGNQYWVGVRVSEMTTVDGSLRLTRQSIPFKPGIQKFEGSATALNVPVKGSFFDPTPTEHPDQVRVAGQIRLSYSGNNATTRYLVGLPDGLTVTEPGLIDLAGDPAWVAAFLQFSSAVTSLWAIWGRTGVGTDPIIAVRSLLLRTASPNVLGVAVSTASAPGITFGDKVQLRGFRKKKPLGGPSLNGKYYCDGVNATLLPDQTIFWLRSTEGQNPADWKILGSIQRVRYAVVPIQGYDLISGGIHKRGRPSMAPRGRRLTRVSLDP